MFTRKLWDHVINTKERFMLRKENVYPLLRRERRGIRVSFRMAEKEIYQTLKVTSNSTSIFCRKEGW